MFNIHVSLLLRNSGNKKETLHIWSDKAKLVTLHHLSRASGHFSKTRASSKYRGNTRVMLVKPPDENNRPGIHLIVQFSNKNMFNTWWHVSDPGKYIKVGGNNNLIFHWFLLYRNIILGTHLTFLLYYKGLMV